MIGMVHLARGGAYTVALDHGTAVQASLRGRLKLEERTGDQVVIGDRVGVAEAGDASFVIEEVFPRETAIVRNRSGGRSVKVLVANADRLLVVVSTARPKPRRELIDHLLVAGEYAGVTPVVVLNKMDLEGAAAVAAEMESVYASVGYDVAKTSALTGEGLDVLGEHVCGGIAALAGPSGVGKSSLINALEPGQRLRTGELSRKSGGGRHTTVTSRLIRMQCGGFVADTPGFSEVGVWGVRQEELGQCFPEFRSRASACRFRRCSHLHEPDCKVLEAVKAGDIDAGRFETYRFLYEEAEA